MNILDKKYTDLLQDILDNGVKKEDRTGTGTISVFGRQIRHDMKDGFPLLTTKKMPFKTIVTELLWFLRGDTNIKYLVDYNCHIWDGDCFANYVRTFSKYVDSLPENSETEFIINKDKFINKIKTDDKFAKKWGELGPIYGKQWRKWRTGKLKNTSGETWDKCEPIFIDQIQNLINDLKTNPDSRRLMVNAWNVGELDQMVLPPCHYGFQVYTRELSEDERINLLHTKNGNKGHHIEAGFNMLDEFDIPTRAISLMWNQRSVDTFLGLPFNIASYGLLLEIIAQEVNMIPEELIGNLGDVHLYSNHIEQAKEQIGRDLTDEERYNIWFSNNYETGMERYFDPNNLPEYDDKYYKPTPKLTREPFQLSTLKLPDYDMFEGKFCPEYWLPEDFKIDNYQSHPTIKASLSN
jgi:thymidylate synthase